MSYKPRPLLTIHNKRFKCKTKSILTETKTDVACHLKMTGPSDDSEYKLIKCINNRSYLIN